MLILNTSIGNQVQRRNSIKRVVKCLGVVVIGLANNRSSGFLFAEFLGAASDEHHFIGRDLLKKVSQGAASKASRGGEYAESVCHI